MATEAVQVTKRRTAVGTRAVVEKNARDFRVVCATCDYGGTIQFPTFAAALQAATAASDRSCRACGAK